MADGIQLPAGYEDAAPVAGPSAISLPAGYTDAQPISGTHASSTLGDLSNKIYDTGSEVVSGFAKGAGDTVSGVSHLLNKIPGVGETLAPSAGISAMDTYDTAHGGAEKAGKLLEGISEFAAGDAALEGLANSTKIVSMAAKYPKIAAVLDMVAQHPWLQKILQEGTKGAITGGVQGTVKGAQQNQAVTGGATGAAVGGALGSAVGAVEGAVPVVKNLKLNPFRKILQSPAEVGSEVAQPAATAAVREGVAAGTPATVGPVALPTKPIIEGSETILDDPLQTLQSKTKSAYQQVDQTVGFDLKEAKLGLKNDQYNLAQLGNTPADQAARKTLQASIDDSTARIADAETKLKSAGIDPKAADALNTSFKAGQDFKNILVRNTAPDGTVNVDTLLKQSKMLRFSKRGDRLAQFMGPQAADTYMAQLEAAQKAGVHAMKMQKLAKWATGLALTGLGIGAGAGAIHAVEPLLSTAP